MVPQTRINKWTQLTDNKWNNKHNVCGKLYPYHHGLHQTYTGTPSRLPLTQCRNPHERSAALAASSQGLTGAAQDLRQPQAQ